jgi:hypothetical protein
MSQETVEQTFTVSEPARLRLSNIRGSVEITPGEAGQILVTAVKQIDSGDAEHTEIRMEQQADGTVVVETHFQALANLFLAKPCKVDYQVKVPQQCNLDLSGVSNTASVQGFAGEIKVRTVSGDVSLRDLSGPLQMNSVSGQVSGQHLAGELSFDVVSGNVRLMDSRFDRINGSTVSGSVHLETPLEGQDYRLNSVSGAIQVYVPNGTNCTAVSSSLSGQIRTNLAHGNSMRSGKNRQVKLGNGGPTIRHSSVSGDLFLLAEGGETAVPQSSEPVESVGEAFPSNEQALTNEEILEKIERGELTVEEGIALLKK